MNNHYLKAVLAAFILPFVTAELHAQVSFGEPELFNDNWKFSLSDNPEASTVTFNDNGWKDVILPHDWSVSRPLSRGKYSCTGWLPGGIGWYRKDFNLRREIGKRYYLYFEGVYNRSTVYLNGEEVGYRPNGYISFMYDITDRLAEDGNNIVAVRVDHSREADSRWYTGSGIYRNVWIITSSEHHFAQWGLFYELQSLKDGKATVSVRSEIETSGKTNERPNAKVRFSVYDAEGHRIAESHVKAKDLFAKATIKIESPMLWSPDSPALYKLKAELIEKGETVDKAEVKMGIRESVFDPDRGYFLNGINMKLKGVCLHHDAGVLGAAVPEAVWRRRLTNLKSIGVNAVRTSHNPQAPVFYDLCDEIGLLVMDEAFDEWRFPKRKWLEGWNVGQPGFEGSYDFFDEWAERDITDMVRRDRTHPSIIMWSIGNEVDYPNDPYSHPILDGNSISQPMYGGYKKDSPDANELGDIAARLVKAVKSADTSRPVTAALAGVVMSNETEYPKLLDIVGYNYTEDRYDTAHVTYPERVIYGSENRADYNAWRATADREFIAGQFIWTGTDYLGESGRWPSRGFHTGLLDFGSFVKPAGRFRAALWRNDPVAYLGAYPSSYEIRADAPDVWNFAKGQRTRVVCYTNLNGAKLYLNGEPVGEYREKDENSGIIFWDLDYQPGELTVKAYENVDGECAASDTLTTSGEPYAIKAYLDGNDETTEDNEPIAHVVVEIVNQNGTRVRGISVPVICDAEGGAAILGIESSDNADMSEQNDTICNTCDGRLLVYAKLRSDKDNTLIFKTSEENIKNCRMTVRQNEAIRICKFK